MQDISRDAATNILLLSFSHGSEKKSPIQLPLHAHALSRNEIISIPDNTASRKSLVSPRWRGPQDLNIYYTMPLVLVGQSAFPRESIPPLFFSARSQSRLIEIYFCPIGPIFSDAWQRRFCMYTRARAYECMCVCGYNIIFTGDATAHEKNGFRLRGYRGYISNLFCERSSAMQNNESDASMSREEWNAEIELINPFNNKLLLARRKNVIFTSVLFFSSPVASVSTCFHNRLIFCLFIYQVSTYRFLA